MKMRVRMKMTTAKLVGGIGVAMAIGTSSMAQEERTFTLVDDGKPAATIVIAADAVKAARFGAHELQHFVKAVTGAELPIVDDTQAIEGAAILVGESERTRALGLRSADFGMQEYLLRTVSPEVLVLMGKDAQSRGELSFDYVSNPNAVSTWPSVYSEIGTMHAVYDFLRDHGGVKWLNPTDAGTLIPERATLRVVDVDVRRRPFMRYRGGSAGNDNAERYNEGGGHWRAGSEGAERFNTLGYALVYAAQDSDLRRKIGMRAQNRLFMYRMKAGGEQSLCNHSLYNFYERFWSKNAKNFEEYHPEYFAQGYEGDKPPQLCYSSEATVQQVIADARDYFDHGGHRKPMHSIARPGYTWGENFYALEPMDNSAFCKCDDCTTQFELDRPRQEQHSTYWFGFVNRVAKAIKESHPDKQISTLAYMTHEGLPTGFKLEDNVVVHFCLSFNRLPYNRDALQRQIDRMVEWDRNEDVPMYLWLYNTFPVEIANNGLFYCFPGFFAHEAKRQFDLFKKLEVRGIFHCGYNGEVENYISYRLMDNPDLDIDGLLDEYFSQYGAAGEPLRKMYERIEDRYCDPENYPVMPSGRRYGGHQNVGIAWNRLGTDEVMEELGGYMRRARELAAAPLEKERVALWDASVWSYMQRGRGEYVQRMEAPMPSVAAPRVEAAGGDPNAVAWEQAASLGDRWYTRGGAEPPALDLSGRICHDGDYVYIELIDESDPKRLEVSPHIACYDDWELFIARQRAQPYRQYLVGPTAMIKGISYGEVNWRQGVLATEYTTQAFGLKAVSDTSGDRWVLRLAFPLAEMTEQPLAPGDTFYMNVMRISSPQLAGVPRYGIDTWVSYTTVKEVDRLGEIKLLP